MLPQLQYLQRQQLYWHQSVWPFFFQLPTVVSLSTRAQHRANLPDNLAVAAAQIVHFAIAIAVICGGENSLYKRDKFHRVKWLG